MSKSQNAEIVFGIISPVGTDLNRVEKSFHTVLKRFAYRMNVIEVTDLLEISFPDEYSRVEKQKSRLKRLREKIELGNRLRMTTGQNDIFARYALTQINKRRSELENEGNYSHRSSYVVHQLKRPEEVELLRETYGDLFFLIGIHSPRSRRIKTLTADGISQEHEALEIIKKDESDPANKENGQKMRDTFQLSDLFVHEDKFEQEIERFLELIMGAPHKSPTREEFCMSLAFSAALRSADLSRQVGAVIESKTGDIISYGANDVPTHGGLYWPGPKDDRDHKRGFDSNTKKKNEIIDQIVDQFHSLASVPDDKKDKLSSDLRSLLEKSKIGSLTEFGRAVHAEMEALLACARVGASPLNGRLYSTTFPCHNCAKHIVAAGIDEVIYVEPYPKSLATELHDDSIHIQDDDEKTTRQVTFRAFNGVGPRRFLDLFSMSLGNGRDIVRKDDKTGLLKDFDPPNSLPRFNNHDIKARSLERDAATDIQAAIGKLNEKAAANN